MNMRQRVEREIAQRVIKDVLAAGYTISVNDGEETTLKRSTDRRGDREGDVHDG